MPVPSHPFQTVLAALGALMEQAARRSPAFWRQITRDLTVEISSRDGVAQHYVFRRDGRTVESCPGPAAAPSVALTFDTGWQGARALASPKAVGVIVKATLARTATITGNPALLLWFYGLTRVVVPLGRTAPLADPLPGALAAPDPASRVWDRIPRLPAVDAIDPAWSEGVAARRTLAQVRGVAGEPLPHF